MSLEALNTFGSLTTVIIVAAAAIAALIQLRHLRAGNQISAMVEIANTLSADHFTDAVTLLRIKLGAAMKDPEYHRYELAVSLGNDPGVVDPAYIALRQATLTVGNRFEEIGILARRGVIDTDMFLDAFCSRISAAWDRLAPLTAFSRDTISPLAWENFEYLAVLAEDWMKVHRRGTYPVGMRRLKITNPWPTATTATVT